MANNQNKTRPENVLRMFQDVAERRGDEACLRFKQSGVWKTLSWLETLTEVQLYSEGLKKLGVGFYDRVAILANTRYEWTLFDLAILSLGAVTVPIYQSTLSDEILFILKDSETRVIIVENSTQLEKLLKVKHELPHLEKIIMLEGKVMGDKILTLEAFRALGKGVASDFSARIREISLDNLASLVYTSGTTGPPKGVMISHKNLAYEVNLIREAFPLNIEDTSLIFLPLAHILARVIQFLQITTGYTHAYAESIEKLLENIQEIKPNFIVSVPRIFEKIYSKVMNDVENAPKAKQKIFQWALKVGTTHSKYLMEKREIPLGLKIKYALAQKLVFSKLHKKMGGRIRFFVSGGAPLSSEVAQFFYAAGILILEGYGLTETTAAININLPSQLGFGTVGKPLPEVEEKIAADGEILVRGPVVSRGYWKKPQATQEALDEEGWFHTGDIGIFNSKGMLKITDRKKDIIVTAGGKNVAPQNIENLLKTNPLFSQIVVHGDRRKFLTALITLNPEEARAKGIELGVIDSSFSDLVKNPKMVAVIKKIVDEKNQQLPKYETIKRFAVLDKDFSIDEGELTPTLKVKRKVVNQKYKDVIESLYNEQ